MPTKKCVRFKSPEVIESTDLYKIVIQRNENTLVENNRVDDTSANGHNAHTSDTAGVRQHLERRNGERTNNSTAAQLEPPNQHESGARLAAGEEEELSAKQRKEVLTQGPTPMYPH